jgi:hypothetical protein
MVALALLLVHVPPLTVFVSVIVNPVHTIEGPLIVPADSAGFTVTTVVADAEHPKPLVTLYDIVDVPIATPDTIPDVVPTVATAGVLLLHVPPVVALDSVVVEPAQTFNVPVIAATVGLAFTDTTAVTVAVQPKPFVTL